MQNRRNYYRVLQVDPDAAPAVIQASYRTLMHRLRMHPDLGGDDADAALVNEAFSTLSDTVRRAAYDRTLELAAHRRNAPAATPPRKGSVACAFCGEPCAAHDRDAVCPACGSPLCPATEHRAGDDARRAMDRLPRELPVAFRRAHPRGNVWRGWTKDLSLNGMRLLSPLPLAVGERLSLVDDVCSAVAVVRSVRRSEAPGERGWECGLEFLTLRLAREQGVLVSTVG